MRKILLALIVVIGATSVVHAQPAGSETMIKIASDGDQFLAVWQKSTTRYPLLVASRINSAGVMLDAPITIASEPLSPYTHAVAFGDSDYLIVWSTGGSLLARRVARDGTLMDANPLTISAAGGISASVVWNGSAWFVVWSVGYQGGGGAIFGAFVSTDGMVSTRTMISSSTTYFSGGGPQVAWNGHQFLVTWSGVIFCDPVCYSGPASIAMVRLASDGTRIDAPDPLGDPYTFPDASVHSVASDGQDFVITYDRISGGIGAARVSIDGAAIETVDLPDVFSWFAIPASNLTWDGSAFVLAARYGITISFRPPPLRPKSWLAVTRFTRDGTVLSRQVMPVSEGFSNATAMLAADQTGALVVATTESDGTTSHVRLHTTGEMHTAAQPPAAPHLDSVITYGTQAHVAWTSNANNLEGFVVDDWIFFERVYLFPRDVAGPNERSTDLLFFKANPAYNEGIDVRAFNEGGTSPISNVLHGVPASRRRAIAH